MDYPNICLKKTIAPDFVQKQLKKKWAAAAQLNINLILVELILKLKKHKVTGGFSNSHFRTSTTNR